MTNAGPIVQVEGILIDSPVLKKAAEHLRQGQLVAFPTETVYGLGGRADTAKSVEAIYKAKGRPSHNPLIVHVTNKVEAQKYTEAWPDFAEKLATHFWPGPLTLVLNSNNSLPSQVQAGGKTIALRVPAHPVAQALLEICGFPIAAPSANRSGHISPSRAEHVLRSLREPISMILDAGPCQVGVESTIIDLSSHRPMILRHGRITSAEVEAVIGPLEVFQGSLKSNELHPSPGLSSRHYAPEARVALFDHNEWAIVQAEILRQKEQGIKSGLLLQSAKKHSADWVKHMAKDPNGYMKELYNALHEAEETGCGFIGIELPPVAGEWSAVLDRLNRAATPS